MRTFNITYQTIITQSFEVCARDENEAIVKSQALYNQQTLDTHDTLVCDLMDVDDVTDYRRCAV